MACSARSRRAGPSRGCGRATGARRPLTARASLGHYVSVEWHGDWYKAEIEATDGDKVQIHYTSSGHGSDEWVGKDRVREPSYPGFAPGDKVEAQASSTKKWYPAHVLEHRESMHLVHYDDYTTAYDEWMGPSRIRAAAK